MTDLKYGWREVDSDAAYGSFDTIEAAEEAAKRFSDGVFVVGVLRPLEHQPYLPDAESIINSMSDSALGQDFGFTCDELFWLDANQKAEAEKELEQFLTYWTARYVKLAETCYLDTDNLETNQTNDESKSTILADALCDRLIKHAGETGLNESAIETLDRILNTIK